MAHDAVCQGRIEAGHRLVSQDHFRAIFFQGHPEYDINSLLKEYKREITRYLKGEVGRSPPFPQHYLPEPARAAADRYMAQAQTALGRGEPLPELDESVLAAQLDNTWGDTGRAIISNWLGLVYNLTALDRREQFMPGVDPENPLGLRR